MEPLGRHIMIELWGCSQKINDPDSVRESIVSAVATIEATILNLHVHAFRPHGVTGFAVLAESHFAVHSWPEQGYLAADVFTCRMATNFDDAIDVLRRIFQPDRIEVQEVQRGVHPDSGIIPEIRRRSWSLVSPDATSSELVANPRG